MRHADAINIEIDYLQILVRDISTINEQLARAVVQGRRSNYLRMLMEIQRTLNDMLRVIEDRGLMLEREINEL